MRDEIIRRNIIITVASLLLFFAASLFIVSYSSRKTIENELINITEVINNQIKETTKEEDAYAVVNSFTKDQEWLQIVLAKTGNGYIVKDSNDDSIGDDYDVYLEKDELDKLNETELIHKRIYIKNNVMHLITQISDYMIIRTSVKIQSNTSFILNSLFYMLILIIGVLILSVFYTRKTSKLVTDAFDN